MSEPDKYDEMTNDIIGNCRNAMRSPDASADAWNVVKFYLAAALREQGEQIERLRTTLREAKECIRIWHNMDCHGMDQEQIESLWRSYDQNSPEMKRINDALEAK